MSQLDEPTTSEPVGRRPTPAGWRKETAAPAPPQHAWQTGGNAGLRSMLPASRGIGVGILLLGFVGLTALFVYELLLLPVKTQLIAAVAGDYRWPLPPDSWAAEDIDGLRAGLGDQTLSIHDLSLAGASSGKALAEFARLFEQVARQTQRGGTAVVYVSAHGVVDRQGRPCLLLPAADPLDSGSWLRLSDLLSQIKSTSRQGGIHWLLILDANRQSENWNIGLVQNTFADGIAQVVADAGIPQLAVLNSTSPGEIGWSSLHFRGTVFGHFLQLGLAGAADENGDGRVSLHELCRYLTKSVDAWTCKHRLAHQTPALYPSDATDFPIAWSLNAKDLARLAAPVAKHTFADEASAGGKLAGLWLTHDELAGSYHPQHYAPGKWQELEHHLVWLEQAATSGAAYRAAFEATLQRTQGQLDMATQRIPPSTRTDQSRVAPIQLAADLSNDATYPVQELNLFSLQLAAYTGTLNPRQAENNSDAQLARLFQRYGVARLWPSPDTTRRAMELHRLGEETAVPRGDVKWAADDRAHAIVRPLLDGADQFRRMTEDALFLGPQKADDIAARLDRANQKYQEIAALEMALAQGYQLRDRAWAELPYLAQGAAWQAESTAAMGTAAGKTASEAPKSKKRSLEELTKATDLLDKKLQKVEKGSEKLESLTAISDSLNQMSDQVNAAIGELRSPWQEAARRLPLAAPTAETLREVTHVLAAPIITGRVRADLFAHYLLVSEEIDSDSVSEASTGIGGDSPPPPIAVGGIRPASPWSTHPVAFLLGQSPQDANPIVLGEKLRTALRDIAASTSAVDAADAGESPDLFEADRHLRRLATLQSAWQSDPFRAVQRRYLQDLLLWHAERALDDFWGTTQPGGRQYFADVAQAYIADARLMAHPDPQIQRRIQRIGGLLEQRNEAALGGLATTATDLVLVDADLAAIAKVGVRETSAAAGLPAGIAAVYLRDDNGLVPQTIQGLEIGPSGANSQETQRTLTVTVPGQDLASRTAVMQAVAMFRGHEFPAPLMHREVGGPRVEVQAQPGGVRRITMRGTRAKKASVVFILDCSHSMVDPVPVEAPDAANHGGQMTKMNIAINALQGMMERLGEQGDVRVGVRFFGHRAGWRTDQNGIIARQENYLGGVPATLRPYEDVELFLPLGRFDSVTAGNVNRRLRTLKPWGESPIFLSLMEALKDFGSEDANTERRVVVITDGMNYQFNPPPEAAPSHNEVENAYANHGIGVDIVGFGIPDEERSAAVRDFTRLAQISGGSFTQATNASALIRRLDQLLVKTRFRALDDAGHPLGEANLGGTIVVKMQAGPPQACTIEVEQLRAQTLFRGAEWLQLAISPDGGKIISLPYEEGNPSFVPLVTPEPSGPSGYHVGLHRPIRESDAVVFPISFQRDDLGIPLPPVQVWAEITPVSQGRRMASDCYVFYDASYEPDLPVPLMRCRCRNWPKGAAQAEVRLWCSYEAIKPSEVIPLARVANQAPVSDEGFELTSIAGVRYQVRNLDRANTGNRLQIRVVERHKPGVSANAVKVELFGPPSFITHQFDWDRGVVLHSFEYESGAAQADPPTELRFCTRDKFTAGAMRMEQPMVLDIAKDVEVVLPPRLINANSPPGNESRQ